MNKIYIKYGDREISIEGDKKFIEKHIAGLKKVMLNGTLESEEGLQISKVNKEIKTTPQGTDNLLLLYQEKKPSTHYDKIALFAYYLYENQGKKTFTISDLQSCYLELRKVTSLPAKLEVTIADTIRHTRYIERAGAKNLKISSTGMNYVLHQLPATTK